MNKLTIVFPLALLAFLALELLEYLPLLRQSAAVTDRSRSRWSRRDSALCLVLTLLYVPAAFFHLGDRQGIESFCRFEERGETVTVTLAEPTVLGKLRYYPGLFMAGYNLQVSPDGSNYRPAGELEQKHADLFKWREMQPDDVAAIPVRYVRLVALGREWLGELALYDADGNRLDAAAMEYPAEYTALFDEQEKIPAADSFMNGTYFDEIYHPRTALEHIENIEPYEVSHPPLGKLILSLGIRLFGMVPFGWRFMGTLVGVLMLPIAYVFLKKMFGGYLVPGAGTLILATDFMHYVQTRLATIDSYAVLFTLLMYLFFWLYWDSDRKNRRSWLPPLALSGLCFGLGAASKWTCIYAGAGLGVLWLLDRVQRARMLYAEGRARRYWAETTENVGWCLLLFVLVPACIYYVSYWPYGTARGMQGPGMLLRREYLELVLNNQQFMFRYHSGVTATHPYSSVWWQWMLDVRPILYYLESFDNGTRSSFAAWVNPLLCWGGLAAMLCMVYEALVRKDRTALFIVVGYLAQLLPWTLVSRVVFEYHYFPSTVFLLLALGHMFRTLELHHPHPRLLVGSFTAVSVLLFCVFFPELTGLPVSRSFGSNFLKWMGTWPF